MHKYKIWNKVDQNYTFTQPIFTIKLFKVGKTTTQIYLQCFDNTIVLFQEATYQKPKKILTLDYSYKYFVVRTPPILLNPSVSDQKGDNIDKLGQIIAIRLMKENVDKWSEFRGNQQDLDQFRSYLSQKINQMGFHQYFRVSKKIGKGSFASVYLAQRIEDGTRMAIKAFCKNVVYQEENGKEGLINEIQIMRMMNHPNLMKLYEVYETQNSIYMCLELLEGDQLYGLFKQKRIFTNQQIHQIMKGLLNGLLYMHNKGVMHRDLKLENILFKEPDNYDSVVIADFGLATKVNLNQFIYTKCGTPGFVAPEIINLKDDNQTYGNVCDIYSLGIIFYILLSGQPAFKGKSYNTVVKRNREAIIDFNNEKIQQASEQQKNLLKLMLQNDPQKRITSYDALKNQYFIQDYEDEFALMYADDNPHISEMMPKLNEEYIKLDLERLKKINDENEISRTEDLKVSQSQERDALKIIMRTPVITGRTRSIDHSPLINGICSPNYSPNLHQQKQIQAKWLIKPLNLQS